MTEYEEVCIGKSIAASEIELEFQYSLGYLVTDNFPQYIKDRIFELKRNNKDK